MAQVLALICGPSPCASGESDGLSQVAVVSEGFSGNSLACFSNQEEESLLDICKEIVERWSETRDVTTKVKKEGRVGLTF